MKKLLFLFAIILVTFSVSCDKEGKVLTPRLTVVCTPEAGGVVDVRDCTVELHATPQLNSPIITTLAVGSTSSSSGVFENLNPNTYYCQIWKDTDLNDTMDAGDFYGFWPQEIVITDTTDFTISIVVRLHN